MSMTHIISDFTSQYNLSKPTPSDVLWMGRQDAMYSTATRHHLGGLPSAVSVATTADLPSAP